jgi:hypothetical protein
VHRLSQLFADACVDRERCTHIHRVADGVADDGVRAVNAPPVVASLGSGEDFIFLRVVEILNV